jgi:hypothetical protein
VAAGSNLDVNEGGSIEGIRRLGPGTNFAQHTGCGCAGRTDSRDTAEKRSSEITDSSSLFIDVR